MRITLDPEQYPETASTLEDIRDIDTVNPYYLASTLANCDRDKAMHPEIFALIVRLYEKAIEAGNADAMNDLGALYYDGRGCCQDFGKAVYYYTMAAEHGNDLAIENLGYCYYYGRSIPADYEKAFQCFSHGAFLGRLVSLYKIGDMYRKGYYVDKNPQHAFRIYTRCIDEMTPHNEYYTAGQVYLRLGYMYLDGYGTEKDTREALRCLQKAELYLYDLVSDGELMYMKSLDDAKKGQERARSELYENLPTRSWP